MSVSIDRVAKALGIGEKHQSGFPQYTTVSSVNQDGSYQVSLNSSSVKTRAVNMCSASAGDRVLVDLLSNGTCAAVARRGGDSQMHKLWENGSIQSDFAEQTVSVDISGYDAVAIVFANGAAQNMTNSVTTKVGCKCNMSEVFVYGGNMHLYERQADVTASGVTFTAGSHTVNTGSSTQDNSVEKPLVIIGIRY